MVTWLQHLLYVPNFIKIGRFFTDIWRFNNFQNGGGPPSWILNICGFCHLALVTHYTMLPHTKFRWNRTIGRFSRWRPPSSWILKNSVFGHVNRIKFNICCSVPNFIKIGRFFTEIWRFNDFRNGGRPPSWISKICRFCHLALEPASPPFWKSLNRHISVKNCPILMKFGTLHQILNPITVTWPKIEIFKILDGGGRHLENRFFWP